MLMILGRSIAIGDRSIKSWHDTIYLTRERGGNTTSHFCLFRSQAATFLLFDVRLGSIDLELLSLRGPASTRDLESDSERSSPALHLYFDTG